MPSQSSKSDLPDDAYRNLQVCVTGGAGFIGSHLVDALLERGASVAVIDDLSNGRRSNLNQAAQLVEGSILDPDALREAVRGCQIIFHQAAVASVPRSVREPELYSAVNATGTLRVLEAARHVNARRVVMASSSSVYGDLPELPKVETTPPQPLSPYAAAKAAGEYLARAYAECYDLSCLSLRYFNIFGPRQRPDSAYAAVLPRFAQTLYRGERPVIYGNGKQTRDFTHVDNAVHANLLAGASTETLSGQVINIAAGQGRSVLDLLHAIAEQLDVPAVYETQPPRAGEVEHSRASIERARAVLGYEPLVSFDKGLERTVAWYKAAFDNA